MDEQRAADSLLAEDGVGRGGDGAEETGMRTGVDGKAVERNRGGSGGVGARTASALGRLLAKIDVRKIGKGAEPWEEEQKHLVNKGDVWQGESATALAVHKYVRPVVLPEEGPAEQFYRWEGGMEAGRRRRAGAGGARGSLAQWRTVGSRAQRRRMRLRALRRGTGIHATTVACGDPGHGGARGCGRSVAPGIGK